MESPPSVWWFGLVPQWSLDFPLFTYVFLKNLNFNESRSQQLAPGTFLCIKIRTNQKDEKAAGRAPLGS